MQNGPNKHGFAVDTGKLASVLSKLAEKDATDLNDKLNKLGVGNQFIDVWMSPDVVLDSLRKKHQPVFAAANWETLSPNSPCWDVGCKKPKSWTEQLFWEKHE
ncbi:hypothetical protein THAOC_19976 [Thalassiosira oceanica]|uniref:Uncharacterized protein n=1 Tax=Thalassiosira oceanica TaxID=159749 RepID=K0S162_THAOC|nr:hypothetical protein THAOC_19976 [Thalassiosira oceanica]|eukprot:EJK59763.1 hypothetical protein THAOC_19976 [Thalassiosira oceanica]